MIGRMDSKRYSLNEERTDAAAWKEGLTNKRSSNFTQVDSCILRARVRLLRYCIQRVYINIMSPKCQSRSAITCDICMYSIIMS